MGAAVQNDKSGEIIIMSPEEAFLNKNCELVQIGSA